MDHIITHTHTYTHLFAENDVSNDDEQRLQTGERNEQITKRNDISVVHGQECKHSRQRHQRQQNKSCSKTVPMHIATVHTCCASVQDHVQEDETISQLCTKNSGRKEQ